MGLLAWLIVGLIAGWFASVIMKTNAQQGMVMDIVMGVIGAIVGGFIMGLLGNSGVDGLNLYSILVATLGAVVVIWLGRMLKRTA
jgi:uncharacterized membrane protein YeaQ/YmgE (transglycosylase-associated protein family)